jgi:hypothetical protein
MTRYVVLCPRIVSTDWDDLRFLATFGEPTSGEALHKGEWMKIYKPHGAASRHAGS